MKKTKFVQSEYTLTIVKNLPLTAPHNPNLTLPFHWSGSLKLLFGTSSHTMAIIIHFGCYTKIAICISDGSLFVRNMNVEETVPLNGTCFHSRIVSTVANLRQCWSKKGAYLQENACILGSKI